MAEQLSYSNTEKHSQGWRHDEGLAMGSHSVRLRIWHDTSYAKQSSAVAEVWLPGKGWTETATYMPEIWAQYKRPIEPGTEGLWDARDELLARTAAVLGA